MVEEVARVSTGGIVLEGSNGSGQADALAQAVWHVNATTGNDRNNGLTAGTALRTFAELENRIGHYGNITVPLVTINVDSNIPASDPLNLLVVLPPDGQIVVQGTAATVLHAGSFTAATTALNRATNQAWQVTDAGLGGGSWAPFVGQRLRITSVGPRLGNILWIAKDLGADVARVSQLLAPGPVETVPTNGDTYVIESLTSFVFGNIDVRAQAGASTTTAPTLALTDLHALNPGFALFTGIGVQLVVTDCLLDAILVPAFLTASFNNCAVTASDIAPGQLGGLAGPTSFNGGLWLGTTPVLGGPASLDFDLLVQGGGGVFVNAAVTIGTLGIFDSTGDALTIGDPSNTFAGGFAAIQTIGAGTHFLYGSGNVGTGILVATCSWLGYEANIPSLTGASDFRLAGSAIGFGFNPATATYYPAGGLACTWANVAAARVGGFGGDAHNLNANAHIVVLG